MTESQPQEVRPQSQGTVGSVYPRVDMVGEAGKGSPSFPEIEEKVLQYWKDDDTFVASIAHRDGNEEFIFYDGPPFANGRPHYGHLLTGYVKDIIPRFRTMEGYKVDRRFGWDCHGLPAELEAERQLGIKDKSQIDDMGIEAFNDYCRESVLRYTSEWREYVTRQARWVDFDRDYKTLDLSYMESVMWAFKALHDKGLIYQGFRVLPYSWYEQTPLSNQETHLDDAYRIRQDPAVTVTMPIVMSEDSPWAGTPLENANLLIWTTTPWTLPSNLAIAVHPEIDYVVVRAGKEAQEDFRGHKFVLAQARLGEFSKEFGESAEVILELKGSDLVGLRYVPPFDYFADNPNSFQVFSADYVTVDSGTGVVHQAPAFGEEDMATCTSHDVPLVIPVGPDGRFTEEVPDYAGQLIFDANKPIIRDLKTRGRILQHETIEHSYPHSWRSGKPLIYMALPSWFVAVTQFRDRMVELNREEITWVPSHVRDGQFGKWLEGARDWNISRNRYWGAPIPVWVSDNPDYPRTDVYGSLDELERDFGVRPMNLHRPYIDNLTRPNPDDPTGKSTMRRVPEVLDCWFESGSMPFAQVHYPFENQEWFENHFPGDFIVEYVGQTRGWFYTLHVLATALFDCPAFTNVEAHGIVLGSDGLKMSKSKRNFPDVNEVFDRDGSDAIRWFLVSSPILRGGNLVVTERGTREGVRQAQLPLWNAYSFLQLYAALPAEWRTDSTNVLDRYILAKLAETRDQMTKALDAVDIGEACESLRLFLDALTNWYVRRSRARFWAGEDSGQDAKDAFDTLYTVLEITCRLAAPLLPLTTEALWRGLVGGRSVHLADWPEAGVLPADADLVDTMDRVREVCSTGSSLRKAHKLRVRLPLRRLTVATPNVEVLEPYKGIIADELNVKEVVLTDDVAAFGEFQLVVNARIAGPRLGKDVQVAIRAAKTGAWIIDATSHVSVGGIKLLAGEYTQRLVAKEPATTAALPGGTGLVVLDTHVDEELEAEGWAKDRVREIQEARRNAGFEVSDRITVVLEVPEHRLVWAQRHADLIAREVLATELVFKSVEKDIAIELGDGAFGTIAKV